MPDETREWDDIHFGKGDDLPPETGDDDVILAVLADDDALEASAAVKALNLDDDDDPPPPPEPELDEDGNVIEPDPDVSINADKDKDTPGSDLSGIELYLSQFDIEAGQIQFDDGTSTHFTELEPARQAEILQELHNSQATAVEDKFGLDETEVGLLNYLRENDLTVEQMVDSMVQEQLTIALAATGKDNVDFATMEPDVLYTRFLKETSPEATPEEIATDLSKAKELSNYDKLTESLRSQFVQKQTAIAADTAATKATERDALVEGQRQQIVDVVNPMTEISGIALDTNIKNNVLDHILKVNDDGDSAFMDEVFTEPESLFRAAFWYVYGESLVAQRDEYWKKEKSSAYKRGKEDALGVNTPAGAGRSFTAPAKGATAKPHTARPGTQSQRDDDGDWSTLHTQ